MAGVDGETLDRFVTAQARVWESVRRELAAGLKTSHWMWFIFPQLRGLGRSAMAWQYGIADRAEADAYLAHATLGPRLLEATELVLASRAQDAETIFGAIDAIKLRSSMTLFAEIKGASGMFASVLDRYYKGARDEVTLARLASLTPD